MAMEELGYERGMMTREPFVGGEIRGQIVEVLLPKRKRKGEKDYPYLKTLPRHIILKAHTVYLQVGEENSVQVGLVDLAIRSDDVSDCLTKVSEDEELAVRVLQRYGALEEHILIADARKMRQSIDIRADFVRIIPPLDEKPDFTIESMINARHAFIGNNNKILITPGGFRNVFDSTRPVLRLLRSPKKPSVVLRGAKGFPDFDRDHLVVLEVCENLYTTRALAYLGRSKNTKDFCHDVKVTVSECGNSGRKEICDGVLFKREASFDSLRGVIGYWFRFHSANRRYIVTFSLWKRRTGTQTSELMDEMAITIETRARKCLFKKGTNQGCLSKPIFDEAPLPGRLSGKQTPLPEQRHLAAETWVENIERSEQNNTSSKNGKHRHLPEPGARKIPKPISEETSLPGWISMEQLSLPEQSQMSIETNEHKTPPRKKRRQRSLDKPVSEDSLDARIDSQKTSLLGRAENRNEKSLPAEVNSFYEQTFRIMKILLPLQDDCEWDEFDREAEQLLKKHAMCANLQIAVILEQGRAACYRSELKCAEDLVKKAVAMFLQASSILVPLFKGRASYYLTGIYRRDKMTLGRAQRCIETARKHLKNSVFTFDRACLTYEEGSLLLEQAHIPCMKAQARRCFDRCIEICSSGFKEDENSLLLKKRDLALIKKAMLLLDCCTKSGRESRSVQEESVIEAKQCLNDLKTSSVPEVPRIAQANYHLARSDQYFREQRLVDACTHAQTAFDLSRRYCFDTAAAAQERLHFVNRLCNSS